MVYFRLIQWFIGLRLLRQAERVDNTLQYTWDLAKTSMCEYQPAVKEFHSRVAAFVKPLGLKMSKYAKRYDRVLPPLGCHGPDISNRQKAVRILEDEYGIKKARFDEGRSVYFSNDQFVRWYMTAEHVVLELMEDGEGGRYVEASHCFDLTDLGELIYYIDGPEPDYEAEDDDADDPSRDFKDAYEQGFAAGKNNASLATYEDMMLNPYRVSDCPHQTACREHWFRGETAGAKYEYGIDDEPQDFSPEKEIVEEMNGDEDPPF